MKAIDTLLTLGKVALRSRPVKQHAEERATPLIIMGNGPTLRQTIGEHSDALLRADTMAVNFAANSEEFFRLKPRHYVLADPHFFKPEGSDPNLDRLWENLRKADWEMSLHVPVGSKPRVPLQTVRFNMTPGEGYAAVTGRLFKAGLAMPRPRNVLIPAIMEGIRGGYREIYLVGADHTWPHTLYVDDRNRVVSVQPHFYDEDPKELDRIAAEYAGLHIHDVLGSMTVAFRSYHAIRPYAERMDVRIYNATPGSLIDAFERKSL